MSEFVHTRMRVTYDYQARSTSELTLKKGQIVFLFSAEPDGWASGECLGKTVVGWFPLSYVTPDTALSEITQASIQQEQDNSDKKADKVDRRSILKERALTVAKLDAWVPQRPDSEQLEEKNILSNATTNSAALQQPATTSAKQPPIPSNSSSDLKKDDKKDIKKDDKKDLKKDDKKKDDKKNEDIHKDKKGGRLFGLFGHHNKKNEASTSAAPVTTIVMSSGASTAVAGTGAYKASRYFRVALSQLPDMKDGTRQIPAVVERCSDYIKKTALDLEGIFRVSGLASEVNAIQQQFDSGDYTGPLKSNDPHAIAGVLKKFFRELPEPLFTVENHKGFIETLKQDSTTQITTLKSLIDQLPAINQRIVRFMLPFLFIVSQHSARNMMTAVNLSIVFGPTFMRSSEENRTGVPDSTSRAAGVVETLILNCEQIFGPVEFAAPEVISKAPAKKPPPNINFPNNVATTQTNNNRQQPTSPRLTSSPSHTRNAPNVEAHQTQPQSNNAASTLSNRGSMGSSGTGGSAIVGGSNIAEAAVHVVEERKHKRTPSTAASSSHPLQSTGQETAIPATLSRLAPVVPNRGQSTRALPATDNSTTNTPTAVEKPAPKVRPVLSTHKTATAVPTATQKTVKALYDYKGDPAKGQLSFNKDDVIVLINTHESGWWTGEIRSQRGYFPSTFIDASALEN